MNTNTTVIISCAGMGTKLGIGTTKALVNVDGKPLIIRQLEMLKDYDDIRVVVGYQAEQVINTVIEYRDDVLFAFNYDYANTGTAASFSKALLGAKEYVVALDGDLLVSPEDMDRFLQYDGECIGGCKINTEYPILMNIENEKVVTFSKTHGGIEWSGIAKIKTEKLKPMNDYVYMMLEPLLPINLLRINAKEIDTQNDYENAVRWVQNGYRSE